MVRAKNINQATKKRIPWAPPTAVPQAITNMTANHGKYIRLLTGVLTGDLPLKRFSSEMEEIWSPLCIGSSAVDNSVRCLITHIFLSMIKKDMPIFQKLTKLSKNEIAMAMQE